MIAKPQMTRALGRRWTALVIAVLMVAAPASAQSDEGSRFRAAVTSTGGVVATDHPLAAEAAIAVLDGGGNAIDAAIAAVFMIGVVRPELCGIGGGGFLVHRGADGATAALDFRERSPSVGYTFGTGIFGGDTVATFGTGHNVIGVPGTVAGMAEAVHRFGTRPLAELIRPAAETAERGFPVSPSTAAAMEGTGNRLRWYPESARVYLTAGALAYETGETLRLPDYAASLRLIASEGPDAFYRGALTDLIVDDFARTYPYPGDHGSLTREDFDSYSAEWRTPLIGSYRQHRIIAMPPPTSGGVATIEILNLLAGYDLTAMGRGSADHLHVLAEAQKIAWADRDRYIGDPDDPDYIDVAAELTSMAYADRRRADINMNEAQEYAPASPPEHSSHTTHVSVIDGAGSAVAVTCSIEQDFGSAVVAPGTGFLLNNQLTDFTAPGTGTANDAEPGKRPRSSNSPTIVVRHGRPVLVAGGAGGPTIIMGTVAAISNVVDFGDDIAHAIDQPRIDARGFGPALAIEDTRLDPDIIQELENRGHTIQRQGEYAAKPIINVAGTNRMTRLREAATDPRADPAEWGAAAQ